VLLTTPTLREQAFIENTLEYRHIQGFCWKLAVLAEEALRCFNCFDLEPIHVIRYKISGVDATLCRAVRPAQIRVSQEAGEILRPRNGGKSLARKSLFNSDG
jgi:hypothetical protein